MNFEEYFEAIKVGFKYWLDIHTDREIWAENWMLGMEPTEYVKHVGSEISNNYFHFDLVSAGLELWAKDNASDFLTCPVCSRIVDNMAEGYCEDCEDETDEELDYDYADSEDVVDFMSDIYYGDEVRLALAIGDCYLWQALMGEGFDTYREAIEPLTGQIEDEIRDILSGLNSEDEGEQLAALAWANHTQHVHGSIAEDYCNIDSGLIDDISQQGLESVFWL